MKAAILVSQGSPLVVGDVGMPDLEPGQVLVRVEYSGICGKQLEEISGKRGADPYLPHLLGHEGAGVVEAVGPAVRKVKPGDHAVLHWMKSSGIDAMPPRYSWDKVQVSAGWVTTFNEYAIVSENRVTPIRDDIDFDVASLLGCAVTTGMGIVLNNGRVTPGQSIVVFGVGGVGLNVVQAATLVNAHPIVAIDLLDNKLKQATEFGATHTLNTSGQDAEQALEDLSGGRGFDVAVDLTGNSQVRELAYNVTSNSGRTVFAGVPHHNEKITIDSFALHFGRTVVGSHGGDTNPDTDIPRYLELYRQGKLKLKEQITHRYPLEDINEAVDIVQQGHAARCVISMR